MGFTDLRFGGVGIRVKGWDFGFRISGFGFRVSGFRFLDSGFRFRVAGFGFRVSGFRCRVSGFGCRVHGLLDALRAARVVDFHALPEYLVLIQGLGLGV